jgi:hypothetical protein
VTQIVDSTAYIPLRTDWMPPRDRRTADGVELLLAGRWPEQVQAAIAAGQFARVSGRIVAEFWECIAACGLSEERKQSEAPAVAPERVADDHVLSQIARLRRSTPRGRWIRMLRQHGF